jgi:hypothetical protein
MAITYSGREHWPNLRKSYIGTRFEIGGLISETLAVVWCHRQPVPIGRRDPPPALR